MVTTPMKCKICSKIISPPNEALIIGEAPQVRNQKILHKLYAHVGGMMEWEASQPHQPHKQALMDATVAGENLKGAMLIGNFEISADMEAERQSVLARVHEITRAVRITDADLDKMFIAIQDDTEEVIVGLLRDLRDRYERLGKYAPVSDAGMMGTHPIDKPCQHLGVFRGSKCPKCGKLVGVTEPLDADN